MNPSIYPRIVPADTFDRIVEYEFLPANGGIGSNGEYFPIAGKKLLCSAQGLSGEEKTLCEKKIVAKCGRRPVCNENIGLAILTGGLSTAGVAPKQCKAKKNAWSKCSQAVASASAPTDTVSSGAPAPDSTPAPDTTTAPDSSTGKVGGSGMSMTTMVIGGVVLLALAGGVFYMIKKGKAGKVQPSLTPAR